MGAVPYELGTRRCAVCGTVDNHPQLKREWTREHGVVEVFRCARWGHEWSESRLPLDDPRNLSPIAQRLQKKWKGRLTHRKR